MDGTGVVLVDIRRVLDYVYHNCLLDASASSELMYTWTVDNQRRLVTRHRLSFIM